MAKLFVAVGALSPFAVVGRLTGFHVDDESCSGLVQDGEAEQRVKCAALFADLSNFSTYLQPHGLRLVADAGTGWGCDFGTTGCFNITYNGKTAPVAHHFMDLTDAVVLMDYDTDDVKFQTRAASYLSYADAQGRLAKSVKLGAAIANWGEVPEWWQHKDEASLEAMLVKARAPLENHAAFGGYAVFHQGPMQNSTAEHPCGSCERQPKDLWYMDHAVVLDTAQWDEWFSWAEIHQVTGLYISPHAGSQALIEVPGIEGSKEAEKTFCDFARRCDGAGIDIELLNMGDWAVRFDLPFVLSCPMDVVV